MVKWTHKGKEKGENKEEKEGRKEEGNLLSGQE